jgi:hypothetical protein
MATITATTVQTRKRGALAAPRHMLAAATPFVPKIAAPLNYIVIPSQLSIWGNDTYGDCVTAEEAFAKACNTPEIFIPEADVIAWATARNYLNGAYLTDVMKTMQNDGFNEAGYVYDDGGYSSVDWTNAAALQSAIALGPVKLGVAADQLETAYWTTGGRSGWFATGFHSDSNEDHCVSLCGYGTISWLASQLKVAVPTGIDGTKPAYAMFTWDSIGIIDVPSMIAMTHEAWLRQPTTKTVLNPGDLLSYGDAGTAGNVSAPAIVGFGAWNPFKFVFGGKNATGKNSIYAVNTNGELLSYGDNASPGNVSAPVTVGFGGWQVYNNIFCGRQATGENRIYAVNAAGELFSYGDAGTPGNVSAPVTVGFGGWQQFTHLFGGEAANGAHRIYAVNPAGQLLSYGDNGTPGNVSSPVIVGNGGWQQFTKLFAGQDATGQYRIYAVNPAGQLFSYSDNGTVGNVSNPVEVGFGGWQQFKFLFAAQNLQGSNRIYAVVS